MFVSFACFGLVPYCIDHSQMAILHLLSLFPSILTLGLAYCLAQAIHA